MNQFNHQDPSKLLWYLKIPNGDIIENNPGLLPFDDNVFEHRKPGEWFYLQGEVHDIVIKYVVNLLSFKMEKFKETKDVIKATDNYLKQIELFTQSIATKILFTITLTHTNSIFRNEFMDVIPKSLLDTYAIIIDETTKELPPDKMYLGNFFTRALKELRDIANNYNSLMIDESRLN